MERAIQRLDPWPDLQAVLLGGSIAKQTERPDSDVDLMLIVTDGEWRRRQAAGEGAFLWQDVADYEHGYVEGKVFARSYLLAAAERGSEPTRNSFIGASIVHGGDPEIEAALPRIPVYPEAERPRRIAAFLAQMQLNRGFFRGEGKRRDDPYLLTRAASEIVLFGGRLLLAHNRVLFPSHKRLWESVAAAPEKPPGIVELGREVLTTLDDARKEEVCGVVEKFTDWGVTENLLGRCQEDSEQSWFAGVPAVADR